jgi:hypothetical protein
VHLLQQLGLLAKPAPVSASRRLYELGQLTNCRISNLILLA